MKTTTPTIKNTQPPTTPPTVTGRLFKDLWNEPIDAAPTTKLKKVYNLFHNWNCVKLTYHLTYAISWYFCVASKEAHAKFMYLIYINMNHFCSLFQRLTDTMLTACIPTIIGKRIGLINVDFSNLLTSKTYSYFQRYC